ncbi:uncharacterized protein EI90DRAFT_1107384 [Cantharellus anzutake]|uniref:uncharacterized protein n=1 Tax=Cantharellus anzutake TaxID=1750568 RepID=UPI001904879F|nr:uncharacterized protein EI90DRAFT_1107384 [Cantharellus anzutake]KAF8330874.1 hypothetical protein EI90DRAFT_1107384 [Cantharellus anzutake]
MTDLELFHPRKPAMDNRGRAVFLNPSSTGEPQQSEWGEPQARRRSLTCNPPDSFKNHIRHHIMWGLGGVVEPMEFFWSDWRRLCYSHWLSYLYRLHLCKRGDFDVYWEVRSVKFCQ